MTRNYGQELRSRGKRRVGWALPIELADRISHEASMRMMSPAKLVELVMTEALDNLPTRDEIHQ